MPRYIDAYSLRDKVFESKKNNPHLIDVVKRNHNCEHEHFLKLIADEPTADVTEQRDKAIEDFEEFAKRLKGSLWYMPTMSDEDGEYNFVCMEALEDYIDSLVKEMVGGNND